MKVHLHHVGLAVGDIEATVAAFRAAFGAERMPEPAAGHVLVRVGDVHLALVPRHDGDPRARARGDHLAFTLSASEHTHVVHQLLANGWRSQDVQGRTYVQNDDRSLTLELLVE